MFLCHYRCSFKKPVHFTGCKSSNDPVDVRSFLFIEPTPNALCCVFLFAILGIDPGHSLRSSLSHFLSGKRESPEGTGTEATKKVVEAPCVRATSTWLLLYPPKRKRKRLLRRLPWPKPGKIQTTNQKKYCDYAIQCTVIGLPKWWLWLPALLTISLY